MCSILAKIEITILAAFNFSSANAFNLVHAKILSVGKVLKILALYHAKQFSLVQVDSILEFETVKSRSHFPRYLARI